MQSKFNNIHNDSNFSLSRKPADYCIDIHFFEINIVRVFISIVLDNQQPNYPERSYHRQW